MLLKVHVSPKKAPTEMEKRKKYESERKKISDNMSQDIHNRMRK